MKAWLRTWFEKDISEVEKQLLIIGDAFADCGQCKELGLDYKTVKECPHCHTHFSYVTSRRFNTHPGERFQIVKRLGLIRNDLAWIDYDDFKTLTGRQKAREFFSD
jgi:hypothetical protein